MKDLRDLTDLEGAAKTPFPGRSKEELSAFGIVERAKIGGVKGNSPLQQPGVALISKDNWIISLINVRIGLAGLKILCPN